MIFARVPSAEAGGALLAHGVKAGGVSFRKGRRLDDADVRRLREAGVVEVLVARLAADDVHEDAAAARLATACAGGGVRVGAAFTGRCNLFAARAGLLVVDAARVDAVNRVHESLTIATLSAFSPVAPRQMVATAKVIPFAAPAAALRSVEELLAGADAPLRVLPFRALEVALVQTRLADTRETLLDKTRRALDRRLVPLGSRIVAERRCAHDEAAVAAAVAELAAAGAGMVLVAGASAIVDRRDVVPAGIVAAGGRIEHFGMPVDPGNLLLLADLDGHPVLGLPGCARSPSLNGLDHVLHRLLAGLPVRAADIQGMGVGGLLKEFAGRPMPRGGRGEGDGVVRAPRVSAVLLAAGSSRRMGDTNKLLVDVDGRPMVAGVLRALLASSVEEVVVVTGHEADAVRAAALAGLDAAGRARVRVIHNPAHAGGLSTSLATGVGALAATTDAVLVALGDMPRVDAGVVEKLVAAFDPPEGRAICVPVCGDKRGNPVLWAREFFEEMRAISGDRGARELLAVHAERVCEVEVGTAGVLLDVDSAEALAQLRLGPRPEGA